MILSSQEVYNTFFFISARTLRRFCQVSNIKRYDEKLLPRDVLDAVSVSMDGPYYFLVVTYVPIVKTLTNQPSRFFSDLLSLTGHL